MKKNYIQPSLEVTTMHAMNALCESQYGNFNYGGGAGGQGQPLIDPSMGG